MQVILFSSFSKRENSTLRPVPGSGVEFPCILKEQTSVLSPIIRLKFDAMTVNPSIYNYAFIPDFGRYYWVRDWVSDNRLWSAVLQVDVLASWKDQIGSSSQYILRSSHSHDGNIADSIYPTTFDTTGSHTNVFTTPFQGKTGAFVIGVMGSNTTSAGGAVTYHLLNASAVSTLIGALMASTSYMSLDPNEISDSLAKCITNPLQYITSLKWLPIDVGTVSGDHIKCGWWDTGISGNPLTGNTVQIIAGTPIELTQHPDAETRGRYLNNPPYTKIVLSPAGFGTYAIDTTVAYMGTSLTPTYELDLVSGLCRLIVSSGGGVVVDDVAQISVDLPLGQVSQDFVSAGAAIVNSVAGAAGNTIGNFLRGDIAGGIGSLATGAASIATGIQSAAQSAAPTVTRVGGQGSKLTITRLSSITYTFYKPAPEDNAHLGRPLCRRGIISSYPGYLMIMNASVDAPCTASEDSMINSYMGGGFYYE